MIVHIISYQVILTQHNRTSESPEPCNTAEKGSWVYLARAIQKNTSRFQADHFLGQSDVVKHASENLYSTVQNLEFS